MKTHSLKKEVRMSKKQTLIGNSKRRQLLQLQMSRQKGHATTKSSSFISG